ncbi:CFI-box-CTERM domain-containing protein [Acidovorax sp. SDU_ACID1]|uniref:CFI-box-CTERM domain-containing protein n=1 Tax=Acidovorax sp. SDU_ACID1 TaxID=3136632 RepID=UPI0038738C86
MAQRRSGRRGEVSATDLAKMGFCEKRVQLAHLYGERTTAEQRKGMARGQAVHQRYFEEGVAATADRRCFVATCVFGPDAAETQVLRTYRDVVLTRRRWGQWAVAAYYRTSPTVCRVLDRSPVMAACVRAVLRIVVAGCRNTLTGGKSWKT